MSYTTLDNNSRPRSANSNERVQQLRSFKILRSGSRSMPMTVSVRILAILFVGMTASFSASAQSKPLAARLNAFPELADESRFILRSADEKFELGIDGLIAVRYEVNHRSDDGSGSSNTDHFEDFGYWARLQADEFASDPTIDALMGWYTFNENRFPNEI